MLQFIFPLIGRFHPLLVHLPIGILLFGVLLIFLFQKDFKNQIPVIRMAFLLGGISALLSSISGFLQYQNEGFAWESVQFHFYLGWITTIFSFWLYFELRKNITPIKSLKYKASGLTLLLLITGHLGGNITHGEEYLTEVLPPEIQIILGKNTTENQGLAIPENGWENLFYFQDVVQPILNSNCKSCHNTRNKKGSLDLSTWEGIQKGGENGSIFNFANLKESELHSRLVLPLDDENHMPPKEKRQPKKEEVELIRLWLEFGASPTITLGEAKPETKLLEPFFIREEIPFYPNLEIPLASEDSISSLKAKGFFIEPVFQGSAFLKVSCINFPEFTDQDFSSLNGIAQNLAYLDLSETQGTEAILERLVEFPNLTILKLNHLPIEGKNLGNLTENKALKHIYLNGTQVNSSVLEMLEKITSLEKVYAYDTPLAQSDISKKFRFSLETGAYQIPPIPSDTIVY